MRGDFGDPIRAGQVRVGGDHRFATRTSDDSRNLFGLGRDDDAVREAEGPDALKDADDERGPAEVAQRLPGEPGGPESGGDDGENAHWLTVRRGRADAKSTPRESTPGAAADKRASQT